MTNILFVASGRRVSLLKAFQDAKDPRDKLICVDSDDLVPSRSVADRFYVIPKWEYGEAFLEFVKDLISFEQIDAIISLMDPATELLVSDPNLSKRLLCTNEELNTIAKDKYNTWNFFSFCGVKVPKKEISTLCQTRPLIARPRKGYGSRGVQILRTPEDMQQYKNSSDYILNEYIEDATEFTVDCYMDHGQAIAIIPRERIATRGGEVLKGRSVNEIILINQIKNLILPKLNFNGCICIQVLKKDMEYYFIEINDRFGGGVPLSFASGANMPKWIFQHLRGETIVPLSHFDEVLMLRADREFFYQPPGIIWEGK